MKKKLRKHKVEVDLDAINMETHSVDQEEIIDLFDLDPLIFRLPCEIALSMSISMKKGKPYIINLCNPAIVGTVRRILCHDLAKIGSPVFDVQCLEDVYGTKLTFTYVRRKKSRKK